MSPLSKDSWVIGRPVRAGSLLRHCSHAVHKMVCHHSHPTGARGRGHEGRPPGKCGERCVSCLTGSGEQLWSMSLRTLRLWLRLWLRLPRGFVLSAWLRHRCLRGPPVSPASLPLLGLGIQTSWPPASATELSSPLASATELSLPLASAAKLSLPLASATKLSSPPASAAELSSQSPPDMSRLGMCLTAARALIWTKLI